MTVILALFDGRDSNVSRKQNPIHVHPLYLAGFPRDPRKRPPSVAWSTTEDAMLRKWVDRYSRNWRLIADCMNSSKLRSRVDLRTPYECYERYAELEKPGRGLSSAHGSIASMEDVVPQTPSTPASSTSMTTRGLKRMATSAAASQANISVNTGTNTVETRKRRHHFIISEMMRKVTKKRELHQRQNCALLTAPSS